MTEPTPKDTRDLEFILNWYAGRSFWPAREAVSICDRAIAAEKREQAKDARIAELLRACKAALSGIHAIKHVLEYTHPNDTEIVTNAWTLLENAIKKAEVQP